MRAEPNNTEAFCFKILFVTSDIMLPVECELIYPCNKRCIPPRLLVWFFSKPSLFLVCKFINMEEVITYQLLHQTAEISFRFFFH